MPISHPLFGCFQTVSWKRKVVRRSVSHARATVVSATLTDSAISVVIVTSRHGEAVRPALDALARELRDEDELIVVDNASGDETLEVVRDAAPGATVLERLTNDGFPAARAPGGRITRRRRRRARGPSLRVRQGAGEVALSRAQPLGDPDPRLSVCAPGAA